MCGYFLHCLLGLQLAAEVTQLGDQLKAAATEAEYINGQEKMFGWATTKYQNVQKVWAVCSLCLAGYECDGHLLWSCSVLLFPFPLVWSADTCVSFFHLSLPWRRICDGWFGLLTTAAAVCVCTCVCPCTQMATALEPYGILWNTVSQFYDKFSSWMNGPFYKLVPEEVEGDTTEAFR